MIEVMNQAGFQFHESHDIFTNMCFFVFKQERSAFVGEVSTE